MLSLEGIGGIGKTSLARGLIDALIEDGIIGWRTYSGLAWVTARRQQINAGGALHDLDRPALPVEELIIALADQLLPADERRDLPVSALENRVRGVLKQSPHLIVVDNLETDADIHALRDVLHGLANPSRFLLTSRRSLYDQIGFFPYRLPELSRADSLSLLRHEARQRNLPHLASAPDDQLHAVHNTVGGNPLALRLVVGLTHVHSLEHVLADLTAARGQAIEQLYTHIYRRAWDRLAEDERNLLLVMPLINENGAEIDLIADIAEQPAPQLRPILERLVTLNLVESRGDLHRRCYTIHSLTRAFLHEQVLRWSPPSRHEQPDNR
ncbi:MAG: NB-ARC domain-containing protein [Caldilineaceae bacterium]